MGFEITYTLDELAKTAAKLFHLAGHRRVWLFTGEMGSGKTTLIKELCRQLEVVSPMSSPTFSIVNTYETKSGNPVFHFDLYRIKNVNELAGIGFTEYITSGNYCFVEWSDLLSESIEDAFSISITSKENNRMLICK